MTEGVPLLLASSGGVVWQSQRVYDKAEILMSQELKGKEERLGSHNLLLRACL